MSHYTGPGAERPDLHAQALCASPDYADKDIWFAKKNDAKAVNEAKRVCWSCPAIQACAEWAFAHAEDRGIWAGMTPAERRQLHGRRARKTGGTAGHHGARRKAAA